MAKQELRSCHDCGAKPGHKHTLGCDNEQCAKCGKQLITCGCEGLLDEETRIPWSGVNPNYEACERLNLWCKWGPGWITCDKDDPEARPDLNTLMIRGIWSEKERKFVGLKDV